ncbi:hypothetical protein Tco_0747802 [Tanacetum coccineum]|uniref:Uncharacterized protein n=1 Tax=Tanacetum coccineum TaxID=301880 RepID=A0ABQ4YUP8_9ASTR
MPEDPYVEAALYAPPSPDFVPSPEEPEQAPPSPDYVPGLEHIDDEIIVEDQPGAEDASPTAQSPDYVPEYDPEADTEEDDDEDPEEDPVDYPADGGDDGDDYRCPICEGDRAVRDCDLRHNHQPHPAYRVTARISIPAPVPTPLWSDAEVARLLAISTPPSSPLSPWSSPLPRYHASNTTTITIPHLDTHHSLAHYQFPTSSPPLLLPSSSRREDRPEVTLPPRKRLDHRREMVPPLHDRLTTLQGQVQPTGTGVSYKDRSQPFTGIGNRLTGTAGTPLGRGPAHRLQRRLLAVMRY